MAYGIQNLMQASRAPRRDVQRLSQMGRGGDDTVGHLTSGEMVVPKELQTPGIMSLIAGKMRQHGLNPAQYIVGASHAQANANPATGAQQFKYGADTNEGGASGFDRDDSSRDGGSHGTTSRGGYAGRGPKSEARSGSFDGGNPDGRDGPSAWDTVDTDDYFTDVREAINRVDTWADNNDRKKSLTKAIAGLLGFTIGGPVGAKLGWKGGGMLADSMFGGTPTVDDYNRDLAGNNWGGESSSPDVAGNRDGAGGFGGRMRNPSEGIRGIEGIGSEQPGAAPAGVADVAAPYADIDWTKYGESGGEVLMYPWQTPTGISYGQYPSGPWGSPSAANNERNDGPLSSIFEKYAGWQTRGPVSGSTNTSTDSLLRQFGVRQ